MARKSFVLVCDNVNCQNETNSTISKEGNICPNCFKGTMRKKENDDEINIKIGMNTKTIDVSKKINLKCITEIKQQDEKDRLISGFNEFDDCLGGGFVKGGVFLLGGSPGVGKSTLTLKILDEISKKYESAYISTEENEYQIKARYDRLECSSKFKIFSSDGNLEEIIENYMDFDFWLLDSVNNLYIPNNGEIGGVKQEKTVIKTLKNIAKKYNKTILLIGQVTKEEEIAGSQVMKHEVDVVMKFDYYDDMQQYRFINFEKNRFGKVNEIVLFEMTEKGLNEVKDPSLLFIDKDVDEVGSCISLMLEGTRPIFVEVQGLCERNSNVEKGGFRQAVGYDIKKFIQLNSVISSVLKEKMYEYNTFINIAGGLKIIKPFIDLACVMSILSSKKEIPISKKCLFLGEVGLTGNIRKIPHEDYLVKIAKEKFGFEKIFCYNTGYKNIKDISFEEIISQKNKK